MKMSFSFSQDLLDEAYGASDIQQSLTDSLPPTQPFRTDSLPPTQPFSQESGFRSQRPPAAGRTLPRPPSCPDFGRGGVVKPAAKRWMFSMSDRKAVGEELGLQLRQISGQLSSMPRHVSSMLEEAVQFLEKMTQGRVSVSEADWGSVKEVIDQLKQQGTVDNKKLKEISDKINEVIQLVESRCASDSGKESISDESITQLLKEVQNQNLALKEVLKELKEMKSHNLIPQSNVGSFQQDRSLVRVTGKAPASPLSALPSGISAARTGAMVPRTDRDPRASFSVPRTDRDPRTSISVPRTDRDPRASFSVPRANFTVPKTDPKFHKIDITVPEINAKASRVPRYLLQPEPLSPPAQLVPTSPHFIHSRPQMAHGRLQSMQSRQQLGPNHLVSSTVTCPTVPQIRLFGSIRNLDIMEMDSDLDSD